MAKVLDYYSLMNVFSEKFQIEWVFPLTEIVDLLENELAKAFMSRQAVVGKERIIKKI